MSMLHDDAGNSEETSRKSLVEKLEEAIDANLTNEQFGVDNLAHLMGMSRSSLHRKLSKSANVSTSQFIREHRLKRALEILKTEDVTASEVAYRVGFSSATYFSTSFHKYYGYPPGEVKSRDHKEGDRPVKNEISESTIKEGRKRILGLVFIILTVLAAAFYYNSNSKGNGDIQIVEDKTNDKSIAVLPFKNWTGSPDLEYVSDGMTDAVTTRLTKISSINKVTPFTSTLIYKESAKAAKEIAAELGVETLLQGNLQISGDQIKINLQLIDGNSNAHIWSEEFVREWKSDEIFKIQSEVVEGIAANMNAAIAKDELVAIQKIPTNSKLAYSYYLQAEFQRNKANEQSYKNAIELYGKAIEVDPKFFGAYVSMARTYNWGGLVWGIYDEQAAWTKSKALLQKALEIYPDNREALNELYSGYYFFDWNFKLVEEYYQEVLAGGALKTIPDFCIDYAKKTGRYKESLKAIENKIITTPVGYAYFIKGEVLMYLGDSAAALELLDDSNLLHSDNQFFLRESAKLYFYLGEYKKSEAQIAKLLAQFTDYPPIFMWLNAALAHVDGNTLKAQKHLDELKLSYEQGGSGSPAWFIALYYAHIRDYEKTFVWLQKSYDRHEVEMTWLREEPLLASLRVDQRYKQLYEKVGFSTLGLPIKLASDL